MKVIVIGTLGETLKKFFELESILEQHSSPELVTHLASLKQILEMWPVEDAKELAIVSFSLQKNLALLKAAEEELKDLSPSSPVTWHVLTHYTTCLAKVRHNIATLNEIGKYVGEQFTFHIGEEDESIT